MILQILFNIYNFSFRISKNGATEIKKKDDEYDLDRSIVRIIFYQERIESYLKKKNWRSSKIYNISRSWK